MRKISPDVYVVVYAPSHGLKECAYLLICDGSRTYEAISTGILPTEKVWVIGYGCGKTQDEVHAEVEKALDIDPSLPPPELAARIVEKYRAL